MRPFLNAEAAGDIDKQDEIIVCQFFCPGQGEIDDKPKSDLHETEDDKEREQDDAHHLFEFF